MPRPEIPGGPTEIHQDHEGQVEKPNVMGRNLSPQPENFSFTSFLDTIPVLGGGRHIPEFPDTPENRVVKATRDHSPNAWDQALNAARNDRERTAIETVMRLDKVYQPDPEE